LPITATTNKKTVSGRTGYYLHIIGKCPARLPATFRLSRTLKTHQ